MDVSNSHRADVVVVGAGVVGLSVGVLLAEQGRSVRVVTDRLPEDTVSAVASAMVGPNLFPIGTPQFAWEVVGREVFSRLAEDPKSGVMHRSGVLASPQVPPAEMTLAGERIDPLHVDDLPDGFAWGFRTSTPLVDMARYLPFLQARLEASGGSMHVEHLNDLADAMDVGVAIVNCAGLGARALCGDDQLRPVLGQHVVVTNPGLDEFFMQAPFGPNWVGIWPHADKVVLGSTAQPGDEGADPDPEVAATILEACIAVAPVLADARVIGHQLRARPQREQVRLEREQVDGLTVVHVYGHGGSGVSWSWGTARRAVDLVTG